MPISFAQAALVAEVEVPTLGGLEKLTIPAGTQTGQAFKLAKLGMPELQSSKRGSLMVQVVVETPTKLTARQEQLLRDYAQTEDRSVMPRSKGFFETIRRHFEKPSDKKERK